MASPAIPTFEQFKAQGAIPTFDQFKAGIPPNPSDSIPAAKAPVPPGLQGPPPSRTEQLVQNLPQSAINAITHPTFPGMPVDGGNTPATYEEFRDKTLPHLMRAVQHPIDTVRDAFVDDPVGSTLTTGQLGKGAVEYGPAAVEAAQNGAKAVAAVTKGAAQGAKEGALSTMPVPGNSYAARALRAVGVDKVPTVPVAAIAGKYLGHALFGPEAGTVGEVVGAATPIVRGAWRGGKQALEDLRTPASVEALPASRQLNPAPRGIPAPEDTSGAIHGWEPTIVHPAPLPAARQLEAGPRVIVTPAPEDPSGVIKGWKPQILENENVAPEPPASVPNPPIAPAAPLPSQLTLEKFRLSPDEFRALPKDAQAEIMAMDRVIQNPPPKRLAPSPVDLAPPPSVEESSAPIKSQEQWLQEDIAAKKAARLAREAAAHVPAQAPAAPTPQYQDAVHVVMEQGKASTSALQRRLGMSYDEAASALDRMQQEGIIGPADGSRPRELLKPQAQPSGPVANMPIPKDFGTNEARNVPVLPGHQAILSKGVHSAGFNPETGVPEIHFGNGGLYRYPNLPPEALRDAIADAPSMGAWVREKLRANPVWHNGYQRVQLPNAVPSLPGMEPGVPPAAEAVPLQPSPVSGSIPPNARLQGQGLPSAPPNGGGTPGEGPSIRQAAGANQPAGANATSVLIPGSNVEYPARYELRELADIDTSHNGNTFQPNPNYKATNERDYTKRDNQGKVVSNSGPLFDPRFHITDNPDATNGPVMIGENGTAAGGNGRGMILQRVYATNPRGAQAYRDLLTQKASQFGIDPAQVAQMKQPVLTRVMSNEDAARAAADLNKTGTAALTPSERAIADSKRVSPGTLNDISARMDAIGPDASLKDVLAGRSGAEVLNRLIDDGVIAPQERAALAQGDDLTPVGKDRISKLMLGRFFRDPAQMDTISPAIKSKLERIAGPIAAAEEIPGWGTGEHLKDAIDLIESAKAAGRTNLDEFVKQSGLYSSQQFPPETVDLAKSLQKTTQGQALLAAKNYLEKARYARDYQGPGMFSQFPEPSNPQNAHAEFLQDIKKPPAHPKPKAAAAGNLEPGTPASPEIPPNPYR